MSQRSSKGRFIVLGALCLAALALLAGYWLWRLAPAPLPAATSTPAPAATATLSPTPPATATPSPPPPTPPATATPQPTRSTAQALAAAEPPARDPADLALRLKRLTAPAPRIVNATPPAYALGDRVRFWVSDDEQNPPLHFAVTATLRYMTPHVYMWVEEGYPVDETALARSAERFETQTYPTNRAFFGSEWIPGVDNDPRLSIFNGRVPGAAGYFYSPNQYSRLINPFSNEREMFFINLDVLKPDTPSYDATLAHEFQHMIHWNQDRNEEGWVNEGLSELAEALNGFSNYGSAASYLRRPDTQLTTWALQGEDSGPHYGAAYLFVTYFMERFGAEALQEVARSELNGRAGFEASLARRGFAGDFDDLFADWVIANYLDDAALEGGRFGYADLKLPRPAAVARHTQFPVEAAGEVRPYGVDYIALAGRSATPLLIAFEGQAETRLADLGAPAGSWAWWSHRGDQADCTLTRPFDLRGVAGATLTFRLWYDIERDWDYAYVLVSTDDGQTWDALESPHMTRSNPNGNSLGPAYTGASGGGAQPAWIEERFDLSQYAGRRILLRFELVTDDAVNQRGLFVDEIAIPEIGYRDDVEAGEGGWSAAGFVRTDNRLPQRYVVQLIQFEGERPVVRRMPLDEAQRGQLELAGLGDGVTEAVLAVSALAPATTEPAGYRYSIRPLGR